VIWAAAKDVWLQIKHYEHEAYYFEQATRRNDFIPNSTEHSLDLEDSRPSRGQEFVRFY
jgi:hypothetical protein